MQVIITTPSIRVSKIMSVDTEYNNLQMNVLPIILSIFKVLQLHKFLIIKVCKPVRHIINIITINKVPLYSVPDLQPAVYKVHLSAAHA